MTIEIEDVKRIYRRGDTYDVPDDAEHTAWISTGYKGIDVFADTSRIATTGEAKVIIETRGSQ